MISIIMPSLNPDLNKICRTLSLILKNFGEYEIILVLQKTPEHIIDEITKTFALNYKLKIIIDSGVGISRARNVAVKSSVGEWILLLDDDVYVNDNVIELLNKNLCNKNLFYYGNALVNSTGNHYVRFHIIIKDLSFWSYNRVCSISLIINRQVFSQIGFFDESFGSGCRMGSSEESDFVVRALLNKIRIKYLKCYSVQHDEALHSLKKVEIYAVGGGGLCRKHMPSMNLTLYTKFICDFCIRLLLLLTFQKKRFIFLKGFVRGFLNYKDLR